MEPFYFVKAFSYMQQNCTRTAPYETHYKCSCKIYIILPHERAAPKNSHSESMQVSCNFSDHEISVQPFTNQEFCMLNMPSNSSLANSPSPIIHPIKTLRHTPASFLTADFYFLYLTALNREMPMLFENSANSITANHLKSTIMCSFPLHTCFSSFLKSKDFLLNVFSLSS